MKRISVCSAFLLALLMTVSLCPAAQAFSSPPSSWAAAQCGHLEDAGLLDWNLNPDSHAPTDTISRGDFCQMLVNLVQMEGDWDKLSAVPPMPDGYFADASSVYSAYGMYHGAAYGITEGSMKNGQRVADERGRLTREQAAKMMCAVIDALDTYGGVPAPRQGAAKAYVDQSSISAWAADSVSRASALGILQGDSSGRFNPKGTLTWQEACIMVDRVYTSAETSVLARRAEAGIETFRTAMDMDALDYSTLRYTGMKWYALENNGQRSVLYLQSDSIQMETYRADGTSAGVKTIPVELDRWGGFYEGEENYYIAFGQDNDEESSTKPVFRIVKYDKNWNRLGAADIADCYTVTPFRASSHTAMAEENGVLVFHTSRLRYLTPADGLRHQSNFTAKIRTSDMTVLSQSAAFPSNHVSHSFAQYVAFDNGAPVYIDHGDAYPRGFALSVENGQGRVSQSNFFSFYGAIGDNTTNAIPGGMGVSADNYLFLGASSPQKGGDNLRKANAFLAVIPKSGGDARILWLTDLPADERAHVCAVQLVQVNNNTFVAMWQVAHPGKDPAGNEDFTYEPFQYAVFDGEGRQTGETHSKPGFIVPTADASVYGDRILWAAPELNDATESFSTRNSRYVQFFALDIDANAASSGANQKVSLSLPETLSLSPGKNETLKPTFTGVQGTPVVTYTSSDPSVATVFSNGYVYAAGAGTTEITASMVWLNQTYTAKCTVTVAAAENAVSVRVADTMSLTVGETKTLTPSITGASGSVTFTSSNSSIAAASGSRITGVAPGTAVITVSLDAQGKTYTAKCTVTVTGSGQTQQPDPSDPTETPDIPGRTDETESINYVTCTKLPADGVVTFYREEYYGTELQLEVLNGNTIRFTGTLSSTYPNSYNYAVLRAFTSKAETPLTPGVPFSVDVKVDTNALESFYAEGKVSLVLATAAQNYKPGDSNFSGISFQSNSTIYVIPDGSGGAALRVVRR